MNGWLQPLWLRLRALNRHRLRQRGLRHRAGQTRNYPKWLAAHDTLGAATVLALRARLSALTRTPTLAVLMAVDDPLPSQLRESILSVRRQLYPHWQLRVAAGAPVTPEVAAVLADAEAADARIRIVRHTQTGLAAADLNAALGQAAAPYVALLDPGDMLREHALLMVAEALAHWPDALVLYSDEDRLDAKGQRCDPYFKPAWNPELLLSQNYLQHLVAYRSDRVREVGAFRPGFEGAQDHDLALRCTQGLTAQQIVHIPHVLYHRRPRQPAAERSGLPSAGERAVSEHLQRIAMAADVAQDAFGGFTIRALAPDPQPTVSILVPTRDGMTTLPRCVDSLIALTRYQRWELVVIDNGSVDPDFCAYLAALAQLPRCRVIRDERPFNFAALNNAAAAQVDSEFIVLLNDDTEVISPDWLTQLVAWGVRPGVGAVGARLWYSGCTTLQHAGVLLGVGDVAGHAHRHLLRDKPGARGRAVLLQDFSAVTAACLLVRRALYLEVGGMDAEHFAVAYNDVDFCLKLLGAGYRNVWVPLAELAHHESASRGNDYDEAHRERYQREVQEMHRRWGGVMQHDPAYNPNLTLRHEDFSLADPPRVNLLRPWFNERSVAVS